MPGRGWQVDNGDGLRYNVVKVGRGQGRVPDVIEAHGLTKGRSLKSLGCAGVTITHKESCSECSWSDDAAVQVAIGKVLIQAGLQREGADYG